MNEGWGFKQSFSADFCHLSDLTICSPVKWLTALKFDELCIQEVSSCSEENGGGGVPFPVKSSSLSYKAAEREAKSIVLESVTQCF